MLLPGKSHGWRSLVGYSPWGLRQLDTTKWLHFHFSLSCIGEGNGNPLQCSCLENPRDGGAWWAAIFGVAQSWTRLKRLSSSSSRNYNIVQQILQGFDPWEEEHSCSDLYVHSGLLPGSTFQIATGRNEAQTENRRWKKWDVKTAPGGHTGLGDAGIQIIERVKSSPNNPRIKVRTCLRSKTTLDHNKT